MRAALAAILSLAALPAAGDISLELPVDCDLGQTCFIQQTVDHDPGPGVADAYCGTLSYDGHEGTDIALPSLAAQSRGVAVLAAAAGTVRAVRDGEPDILQGSPGAPDVDGIKCGNGVLLTHPDGWETQYCHMARGSIAVDVGDRVTAGTPLGRIGLSGATTFPHLHLSVRRDGVVVDPFAPDRPDTCGDPGPGLWAEPLPFPPGGVIATGFADATPAYDAIKAGDVPARNDTRTPMVLWGYLYGSQAGDVVRLAITGPDGRKVFTDEVPLDRTQAQLFRSSGRRAPAAGWAAGDYSGTVTLLRDGAVIGEGNARMTLD